MAGRGKAVPNLTFGDYWIVRISGPWRQRVW